MNGENEIGSKRGDEIESFETCLTTQLHAQPSAAHGTAMRADTVRRLAAEAGYKRVAVVPVENDFLRLYRLDPSPKEH